MRVLSAQALVALLFAVGIEQALALPTAEVDLDVSLDARAPAPGHDKNNPIVKEIDITPGRESKYPGYQELFDADCYAHLCKGVSVLMNHWSNPGDYNRKKEHGNGVGSHNPWADDKSVDKYKVTRPSKDETSPEEWPPASVHQGGRNAILFPVTKEAQSWQATVMSSKLYGSNPKIPQQDGDKSDVGTWFRISKWDGTRGPYCAKLNELLANYNANFNSDGTVKNRPSDPCDNHNLNLNGLKYDVGKYAYTTPDGEKYNYAGK